jgi:hypothetical protein
MLPARELNLFAWGGAYQQLLVSVNATEYSCLARKL